MIHHDNYGRYAVVSSCAKMPAKVKAPYRHVAVIKTEQPGQRPTMISEHARGVVEIVQTWRRLNVGKCKRSAFVRALDDARALAGHLFTKGG